jgi:predicted GH43/DUF377 family glycosyl hydrolase
MNDMQRIVVPIYVLLLLSACAAPATPSSTLVPTTISAMPTMTVTSTPKITATPAPFFILYSDTPVVSKGQPGTWDDRYTDPGAVIYHDGMFHMFRNGFRGFPAESQVGYVTSLDGYTWTKQGDNPVFKTSDVPYAKVAMYASSVVVETDGTWVLYFYTWDSKSNPSSSVIGRATAPNPMGPWVADAEPILIPGVKDEWDGQQVLAPHILKTDGGYVMYYEGVDAAGIQQIGMAISSDGVDWKKYDDPSTTAAPFAGSDPIFRPSDKGSWDSGWVHQPRVFQTSSGWVMIYRGIHEPRASDMKLGLATSDDGIHWERFSGNPVFEPRDIKGARQFWFTNAILKDGVYYLFVEGDISQTTQIYLATHEGEAIP